MLEAKLIIEAPELASAITNLALALAHRAETSSGVATLDARVPVAEALDPTRITAPSETPATATPGTEAPSPVLHLPTTAAPSPAPQQPTTPAPSPDPQQPTTTKVYTFDDITNAGAQLLEMDRKDQSNTKMMQLMELLKKYGVQAVTQLKPEQYADVAAGLRELGATI